MKKLVCVVLVLLMLVTSLSALAEIDVASMSDSELHSLINLARNELAKREIIADGEKIVLVEQDGVTLYLTGDKRISSDKKYMYFSCVVINDSDKSVSVTIDSAIMNGWSIYGSGIGDVPAGTKKKGDLDFRCIDAEVEAFDQLETLTLNMYLYDMGAWKTISDVEPITLHFNAN